MDEATEDRLSMTMPVLIASSYQDETVVLLLSVLILDRRKANLDICGYAYRRIFHSKTEANDVLCKNRTAKHTHRLES